MKHITVFKWCTICSKGSGWAARITLAQFWFSPAYWDSGFVYQAPQRKDSHVVAGAAESVGSVIYSSLPDAEPIEIELLSFHLESLIAAITGRRLAQLINNALNTVPIPSTLYWGISGGDSR